MPLPDLIEIVPLDKPVRAEITVPGSKSITNRALILAALADGEVTLTGALWSEDTQVMTEALQRLGFEIKVEQDPDEFCNRTITVKGQGGRILNAGTAEQPLELFVGNAGTAARFLAAMVCLGDGVYRLSGVPRMHERPQAALFKALRELGYRVDSANDKLPAVIHGKLRRYGIAHCGHEPTPDPSQEGNYFASASCNAPLLGGAGGGSVHGKVRGEKSEVRSCSVSIDESSQFASALLLSAKHGGWDVTVSGDDAEEAPYVTMTEKLVNVFPWGGGKFQIEPDASSGSYFLAASRLVPVSVEYSDASGTTVATTRGESVRVACWPKLGWQVDERFQSVLSQTSALNLGLEFERNPLLSDQRQSRCRSDAPSLSPQHLARERLRGLCESDKAPSISRSTDLGDSIMTAIVVSPFALESIQFTDLGRLRLQECERVVALRTELTKCGAKVVEEGDMLTVYPSKLHGAEIETYNDHRMAMCFAILGLKVPGIKLKNPSCVKKTFPNFFQKLAAAPPSGLGATIVDAQTGRKLGMDELFAD